MLQACPRCHVALPPASQGRCPSCALILPTQTTDEQATRIRGETRGGLLPWREAPKQLGPYRLERELARGGMGAVYVGKHTTLGQPVAIKLLTGTSDPRSVKRFQREALATAKLRHPNIVAIHHVGEEQGVHYLVMDLIEGGSLTDALRTGPLEPRRAAEIMERVARAIQFAHEHGILHRDLKPANILLHPVTGDPVVTDLGLAKRLDAQTQALTKTGAMLGTPAYMAPEQARGTPDAINAQTDVYALGATLYELLTGALPFEGDNLVMLIARILNDPPTPPSKRAAVPSDLDAIVLRCLEKQPERRYATAGDLADDLARFLKGAGVEASARGSSLRWLAAGLVGALLLLGAGAIGAVVSQPSERPDSPDSVDPPPPPDPPTTPQADPLPDLLGQAPAVRRDFLVTWLDENPDHPQRTEAERALRQTWLEVPRLVIEHAEVHYAGFGREHLLTGDPQEVTAWDLQTGAKAWSETPAGFTIERLRTTPRGDAVLLTGKQQHLLWIELPSGTSRRIHPSVPLPRQNLNVMEFSPSGRRVALGDDHQRTVTVLDLPSGEQVERITLQQPLRRVVFLGDEETLAIAPWATKDWTLQVRSLGSDDPLVFSTGGLHPLHLSPTPRGSFVVGFKGAALKKAGFLRHYDAEGEVVHQFSKEDSEGDAALATLLAAHEGETDAVACDPLGRWVASVSRPPKATLRVWSLADGALLREWPLETQVRDLRVSPDGSLLLQIDWPTGPVLVWDLSGLQD